MSNRDTDALQALYEEARTGMTVGDKKIGDLDGPTKETNKGTGSANTDAKPAKDAEAKLQGDTVAKSTDKSGKKVDEGTERPMSKFDALFNQAIMEEDIGSIEGDGYDDDMGDFPAQGEDMADAELGDELGDEMGEESESDLFAQLADIFGKLATKFGGEGDMGMEGEVDALELEAVESTPAPDGVTARTNRSAMNTNAAKTVSSKASSATSGAVDGGKPKVSGQTKDRNPQMSFKAKGSGKAVDGKNSSAFE
jgi:hypothetical protein